MAKLNYEKFRALAEKLINKYGQSGTVYSVGKTGKDMFGNAIQTNQTSMDGIVTPLLNYSKIEVDGVNVLSSDCYVFFHSSDEPVINMLHDQNGETYRIVSIDSLTSVDGVNVYRKLQLRK